MKQVRDGKIALVIAAHAIAELYSTLTAFPVSPRIQPEEARQLIVENISQHAEVIPLSASDYFDAVEHLSDSDLRGGITYDALHVWAARIANVQSVLTLNERDFVRVWPDHGGIIESL